MKNNHHTSKAIFVALLSNLLIAIAKLFGFFITKSASMLSESIHSLADCANQILLFIGLSRSKKLANSKFNLGHGREEFLWAFLVAIILFTMGSLFSLYEGILHIMHPQPLENLTVILVVLLIAILLEGYSFLQALKSKKSGQSLLTYLRKTSDSASAVVLIEDFAALIGLLSSFVFILLAKFVHPIFDGIGATVTGLVLGVLSIVLAIELGNLIKGESLPEIDSGKIKMLVKKENIVESVNSVESTIIGNNKYLIIVSVDPYGSDNGYSIEKISKRIKEIVNLLLPNSKVVVDFCRSEDKD